MLAEPDVAPRARLPLGRRRRALPRLADAPPARHARGERHDAAAVGGRRCPTCPTTSAARRPSGSLRGWRPGDRPPPTALARRLGTSDAVVVGLGAMLGAGVFVGLRARRPRRPGAGCWSGCGIAAVVAFCNAVARPSSRRRTLLGRHLPLRPRGARPVVGLPRRVGLRRRQDRLVRGDGDDVRGVRPARPAGWWQRGWSRRRGRRAHGRSTCAASPAPPARRGSCSPPRCCVLVVVLALGRTGDAGAVAPLERPGARAGVLQAAGLLFFAFAGYARIATLAEEVRRPELLGPRRPRRARRRRRGLPARRPRAGPRARRRPARLGHRRSPRPRRRSAPAGPSRSCGSAPPRPRSARCSRSSPASAVRRSRWRASATCRDRWRRSTRATRCRTGAGRHRRRGGGAGAGGRPARRDRLLVLRRARLLRRRQPLGAAPARRAAPLAARPAGARAASAAS